MRRLAWLGAALTAVAAVVPVLLRVYERETAASGAEAAVPEVARRPEAAAGVHPPTPRRDPAASNVFAVLPGNVIVRQGETLPPMPQPDPSSSSAAAARARWNAAVGKLAHPPKRPMTASDCLSLSRALRDLPGAERVESLAAADNVVVDDCFIAVAAIALDTSFEPEVVAKAFDLCLNRPDNVKLPVLEEIRRHREHPMYVEAARLLDIHRLSPGEGR